MGSAGVPAIQPHRPHWVLGAHFKRVSDSKRCWISHITQPATRETQDGCLPWCGWAGDNKDGPKGAEEMRTVTMNPGEVAFLICPHRCSLDPGLVSGLLVRSPISTARCSTKMQQMEKLCRDARSGCKESRIEL